VNLNGANRPANPDANETIVVAVVTYNSEALIPDLVAALGPGLAGFAWHLVVADNASRDGSVAAVRRLAPQAIVVEMGRNAGYAAGINAAVAAAPPHTAVLVLNPDVRLAADCGAHLMAALRRPHTGIAVPRLVDGAGVLIPSMRREPTTLRTLAGAFIGYGRAGRYGRLGELVTDERRYDSESVTDWAEGSTQLISAECWRHCGPWDESFFLYSEETDFALRARDAGFVTRYTPLAHAVHLEGDSRVSPFLYTLLTLNRVRLHRRRHGRLSTAGYWGAHVLRELSRAPLGRPTNRAALRALLSPRRLREKPGPQNG
jgi:GT2 family glycosyltransferase